MSPQNAPGPSDSDPGIDALWNGIDELSENASVRRVFGDPIEMEGKTVVPVARVGYGFGGGFGSGPDTGEESGGGGGGGGAGATPVGVLEVTETGTRFVRFRDWRRVLLAVGAGLVLGWLLGRR